MGKPETVDEICVLFPKNIEGTIISSKRVVYSFSSDPEGE